MSAGSVCLALGALLVVAGLAMMISQIRAQKWKREHMRGAEFGPKGISLKTTFPGLLVIGIGAVLVMTGATLSG